MALTTQASDAPDCLVVTVLPGGYWWPNECNSFKPLVRIKHYKTPEQPLKKIKRKPKRKILPEPTGSGNPATAG